MIINYFLQHFKSVIISHLKENSLESLNFIERQRKTSEKFLKNHHVIEWQLKLFCLFISSEQTFVIGPPSNHMKVISWEEGLIYMLACGSRSDDREMTKIITHK